MAERKKPKSSHRAGTCGRPSRDSLRAKIRRHSAGSTLPPGGSRAENARRYHQHVHAPPACDRLLDETARLAGIGDVGMRRQDLGLLRRPACPRAPRRLSSFLPCTTTRAPAAAAARASAAPSPCSLPVARKTSPARPSSVIFR